MESTHTPVLLEELVEMSFVQDGDLYVDCTFGGGSHTKYLLQLLPANSTLIAFDLDLSSLKKGFLQFQNEISQNRLKLIHGNFAQIRSFLADFVSQGHKVSTIIADLGVSSFQFDLAERGFSLKHHGPLDMRMDQSSSTKTAANLVNELCVEELTRIFTDYGEEPRAYQIAKKIVSKRSNQLFTRTDELANLVSDVWSNSRSYSKKHPATRVFQALRIAVNKELESLQKLLHEGFELLAPGGKMGLISFHSLEDRMVKKYFQALAGKTNITSDQKIPYSIQSQKSKVKIIEPFPTTPSQKEIHNNPRSRSAKLRVVEKL